jgi:glycosyltransferase involved in cell wall biosynthesis
VRSLSFIVPVYRSKDSLEELYKRIIATFGGIGSELEIIFVEDCGGDDSWDVISRLAMLDPRVRGLQMSRNFGQHNALLCGIREASGEVLVTLDDDLQHPPEVIPELLNKLEEGFDVVYGSPMDAKHSLLRNLASQITKFALQSSMGASNARKVSALRVFRTNLREGFSYYRSPTVNIDVLLTWATNRFAAVNVRHESRRHGESGYTVRKLLTHAFNMITGFSTLPLQIASCVGFAFSLFGLFILVYLLCRWMLIGSVVPGFVFIASMIAIFSGAQLLALGIMGEYIARMHFRSMDRPSYVVRRRSDCGTER